MFDSKQILYLYFFYLYNEYNEYISKNMKIIQIFWQIQKLIFLIMNF